MASIRDVARLADVSTATVSHVINGTRFVSPELTERVEAVLLEVNYRPDAVARSLRRRETLTIGLLIPSLEIPFFASVAYHLERAAADQGYNVILCNSDWEQEEESIHLQDLIARRVDGIICIIARMGAANLAPVLEAGIPVVMFERRINDDGLELDAVGINNESGAYMATKHLLDLGHLRFAVVTGSAISTVICDRRLAGYRKALDDAGLSPDPSSVYHGDFLPESGRKAVAHFLSLPERPTAIFAFNDMMALGVLQALDERGLRVPKDIAVVGFDGIPLSQYTSPGLTTIRQPLEEMSRAALDLLLRRIRGDGNDKAQYIKMEPQLVVRASTVRQPLTIPDSHSERVAYV